MKFGKRLKRQIEQSLPEWRDKYLSYKELKKLVKLISSAPKATTSGRDSKFMHLLNDEIDKFNAFFMEQEEDFVIRHKELAYRIEKAIEQKQEMPAQFRTEMVNFHGEMVLLINYSNINYTGLAKILKKLDKRTGRVLRLRVMERVLEQPFFKTELISKLVKECEAAMESVFPAAPLIKGVGGMKAAAGRQGIFGNTVAALVTMQEMRKGSSTYSHFSLPPLNLPDFDIQSLQLHSYPHTHTLIT